MQVGSPALVGSVGQREDRWSGVDIDGLARISSLLRGKLEMRRDICL